MATLLQAIKEAEKLAEDGDLSQKRINSLDQYLGEPYGYEVTGRSQVVDRTIQNTVEWIKPQLLKIFCAGDSPVEFMPTGPEDVEQAKQESDYVSFVATQKNNWFDTCYQWFSDALIQKNGYVKVWWDEAEDITKEDYDDLSDEEFAMILQDQDVEIVKHEEEIEDGMLRTHSVTLQRKKDRGQVRFKALPPEQVLVSHNATGINLQDVPFCEHWEWKTISELRLQGFDVEDNIGDESENQDEDIVQRGRDSAWWQNPQDEEADPSMRRVKVREIWIRFDDNDDGKAELLHVIVVGSTILEQEEVEFVPLAALTPQMMPHRHSGMSVADAVDDLQLIKTTLLRGMLDNMYLANNGRYGIDVNRVNLEDMLTSRPGGVVRVQGDPGSAIFPLVHQSNFAPVMQMLAYIDDSAESRTGVTKYTQGLDANNLNKTATGVQSIMSASQERVMLIARIFSETGVKELFWLIHAMVRKHQNKPDIMLLRNQWIPVDPRTWVKRYDMTIKVGLGTGNANEKLMHLNQLYQMQLQTLPLGITTPRHIYNTFSEIAKNAGFKTPEEFVQDPSQQPPQQPQPDPKLMLEQQKLQADVQKFQAEQLADQNKFKAQTLIEQQKAQQEAALAKQMADRQMATEQQRSQNDLMIEREKLSLQAELERYKAQLKAETDIQIAMINAEIQAKQQQQEAMHRQSDQAMQIQMHNQKIEAMTKPKEIVRDQNGRVNGVK